MEHLHMHSLNKIDENISKIARIFPNCVTEAKDDNGEIVHKIDFDMLKQELSHSLVEGREERYQFTWPDKKQAILTANAPINKTLRPCREESVNFDKTENLYIEGDNLEVLKLLQETYLGKIKMIYIDPPYNTGNDFVYNDDFSQDADDYMSNSGQTDEEGNRLVANTESNGRFHTDWLNMMYPRLKLARDLLSDDGVIFISIDDNEVDNLKKICDEIFGNSNFSSNLVWQKKTGASDAKGIATITENILIYAKNNTQYEKSFTKNTGSYDLNRYKYTDEFENYRGPYYIDNLDRGGLSYSDSLNYGIECPDGTITFPNGRTEYKNDGWIWKWSKQKIEWARENKFIEFRKTEKKDSGWSVCYKNYLKVDNENKPIERAAPHKNLILDVLNANAAANMKDLFGTNNYFDYSKPVDLIKRFLSFVKNQDSIILDFFSGSATTAHAVMQLNAEDGGNRKFIMVQLPELCDEKSEAFKAGYKNICEIGKERIRRAGQQILEQVQNYKEKSHTDSSLLTQTLFSNEEEKSLDFSNPCDNIGGVAGVSPAEGVAENAQAVGARGRLPPSGNYKLDIGFRVLKCDTSNMEDVYYTPDHIDTNDLFKNNIKSDRNGEDLLFQTMLDLGILLSSKIETKKINDKEVFCVEGNYLMACFDDSVDEATITEIAKEKPYYFVMRDPANSKDGDSLITNFEQIFTTYSPETVRKIL